MTLLWLQPLNTSVNIAFGYNATIFCADQASNEVTFALLPVEAIVSYNNDANYLVEVRHFNSCDLLCSQPGVLLSVRPQDKAHAVSLLKGWAAAADPLIVYVVVLCNKWAASSPGQYFAKDHVLMRAWPGMLLATSVLSQLVFTECVAVCRIPM